MPLDGHSYLISQGWSGLGTGLRQDALIRPLAIPHKRTLSGLGKDRDEAFPFWDQFRFFFPFPPELLIYSGNSLFSVAAKTIQVKLHKDDDDDDDDDNSSSDESHPPPASNTQLLDRTSTGILSNKAPKRGTPASTSASASNSTTLTTASGSSTPPPLSSSSNLPTTAKQEAAKRILYSHFFRGPTLSPDSNSNNPNNATTIPNTDSGTSQLASTTTDNPSEQDTTSIPSPNDGSKAKTTPMAMAKAKMTDTIVVPPNTTNRTCEVHQDRHHHRCKRKRDKVIDEDENVIVINTSHQQRKGERKEERKNSKKEQKEVEKKRAENVDKKKQKKEKKQLKLKATHEPEEPISGKKKRQRLNSSTSSPVIDDPAPAQDLQSGVNNNKEEKTRDRDQLKGEVKEDGGECRNHERKDAESKKGLVPMVLEGLESKKKKRCKSKDE